MPKYIFVIEDRDDGGVNVELEGDGIPAGKDPTPAGLLAVAVDTTIQNLLGPSYEVEDVDVEGNESSKSQQQT